MARNNKPKKTLTRNSASGLTIKNAKIDFHVQCPTDKHVRRELSAPPVLLNGEMRLAKIRDRYMFNSNDPTKEHTYAVYIDDTTKEVRAVETTHLYVPDKTNIAKLNKGLLRKVKFDSYETPSGVNNYYYNADRYGNPIDLSHADVSIKALVPQSQAMDIKRFAKNPRKR